MKKVILCIVLAGIVIFGLIQLLPIGKDHTNPSTVSEPNWNSPETRAAAKEHCFQCHSNETEWPWYSNIAPASWLIYADVVNGRRHFNFSDWNARPGELNEMVEVINSGEMPPIQYWIFHPGSRLSATQKQALIDGLKATLSPNTLTRRHPQTGMSFDNVNSRGHSSNLPIITHQIDGNEEMSEGMQLLIAAVQSGAG